MPPSKSLLTNSRSNNVDRGSRVAFVVPSSAELASDTTPARRNTGFAWPVVFLFLACPRNLNRFRSARTIDRDARIPRRPAARQMETVRFRTVVVRAEAADAARWARVRLRTVVVAAAQRCARHTGLRLRAVLVTASATAARFARGVGARRRRNQFAAGRRRRHCRRIHDRHRCRLLGARRRQPRRGCHLNDDQAQHASTAADHSGSFNHASVGSSSSIFTSAFR